MRRGLLLPIALLTAVAARQPAECQDATVDLEARGIRLMEWEIYPSVEVRAGYETNVLRLSDPGRVATPDDVVWEASASLRATRQGGHARLSTSVDWDIRKFLRNPDLDAFADFDALAELVMNPEGNMDFQVSNRIRRETRPLEVVDLGLLRRTSNTLQVGSGYHPGGPLTANPNASWTYERFVDDRRLLAERNTLTLGGTGEWRFFPKTSLAVSAEAGRVFYTVALRLPEDPAGPQAGAPASASSTFARALGGVSGKFTEKVNGLLKVGLAHAWYDQGPSAGPTVAVESVVRWTPQPRSVFSAGYTRGIVDSYFTNYYLTDRIAVDYKHLLRGRLELKGRAALASQRFSEPFERNDTVLWLEPSAHTRLGRWFDLGITYRFAQRISRKTGASPSGGFDASDSYASHAFFIDLIARY